MLIYVKERLKSIIIFFDNIIFHNLLISKKFYERIISHFVIFVNITNRDKLK